jgi:hypothetical protein
VSRESDPVSDAWTFLALAKREDFYD